MPEYTYGCKECDNIFSEDHKIVDRAIPTAKPCEKCSGELYIMLSANNVMGDPYRLMTTGSKHKPQEAFTDKMKQINSFYSKQGGGVNVR